MKLSRSPLPLAGLAALLAASCGTAGDVPPPPARSRSSPIAAALFGSGSPNEGERLFGQECAFCHVGKSTGAMMLAAGWQGQGRADPPHRP
jgi:cytochrome c5